MIPLLGSVLAIAGMVLNISGTNTVTLPDIGGALLIAAVVARRRHWRWVFPLLILHDMVLYWSALPITLLFVIFALFLVIQVDVRLGAALPQRIVMIVLSHLPMVIEGYTPQAITLSLLLTFVLWYWIREQADTLLQSELETITSGEVIKPSGTHIDGRTTTAAS
ncbi:MAG: hypothetical protein Q9M13_00650 [Mariprofundales bacterium]|nr:hypothetical protein [Mariprofundales bacterium]